MAASSANLSLNQLLSPSSSSKPSLIPITNSFIRFRHASLAFESISTAAVVPSSRRAKSAAFVPRAAAADAMEDVRKTYHGLCYVLGDNIDTDQIISAELCTLNPSDPIDYEKLGSYALVGLPDSYSKRFVEPGEGKTKYTVIIAGDNFGCGSSREHAPVALGASGARAVVAESYARIFFRNSVATGEIHPLELEVRVCDECRTGDLVTVELRESHGVLINHSTGKEYKLRADGDAGPVIDAGGIFAYARKTGMISSASS